jgi:ankyrin repeat protein
MSALLDAGADVAVQDIKGDSALHIAGLAGEEEAFEMLTERGADRKVGESASRRIVCVKKNSVRQGELCASRRIVCVTW